MSRRVAKMEKYELVKDIGAGNFGVARLMKVKDSKELARYFFQQLISGVSYCHAMQICHRDLKLENTLLDGSPAPRLKICDFGYSKSSLLHSRPKSTVGTPAYIAPEVLSRREYDGKMADVWSCGVTLYVMLVGAYPFEDQEDPKNFRKTIQKIMAVQYKIPDYVHISQDCKHLLSRIFVANSVKRITIAEIKKHPWFTKNLPRELTETAQAAYFKKENPTFSAQTAEEIMKIVDDAKTPPPVSRSIGGFGWGGEGDAEEVDEEEVEEDEDEEDEYDKTVKEAHASGEKYKVVKDIGAGYIELGGLMRVKNSKELVAMKFIERGSKARYLFQQLISAVSYCHAMLEDTFLDGSPEPCLKICDFSYSKSVVLQSCPSSKTRTAAYIPPEIFSCSEYDGKMADIWSCGVTLYVMLVGARPFEDENDHRNFGKTMQVEYKGCPVQDPRRRSYFTGLHSSPFPSIYRHTNIKKHPWFLKNLPSLLTETAQAAYFSKENQSFSVQAAEEIMKIVDATKRPPPVSLHIGGFGWGEKEGDAERQYEE
ncbi:hypothetical protein HID58_021263 [Brassica napus]|uniref:non-specific serine/threonine protein kinase n=1 Tax=Brassica napus TaxID=3708 RepID=A0ABQ8CVX6_BRANA|nr:hypothetical protein HID58_021263 [Brassica napus]